jgi:hypothetical protein
MPLLALETAHANALGDSYQIKSFDFLMARPPHLTARSRICSCNQQLVMLY